MSAETEAERGYDAVDIERALFAKMKRGDCTGADALEIARFLLARLEGGEGQTERGDP